MNNVDYSYEKQVINILIEAVNKIEYYTKKVGFKAFEKHIGFLFSRLIDNRITRSDQGLKDFELATVRAASYVIVIQILFFLIFSSERDKNRVINSNSLTISQIQCAFDKLEVSSSFSIIFSSKIIELLPKEAIKLLKSVILSISKIDLEILQTDIIGKIFHQLIPFELRKFLAAFYTSNVVSEFLTCLVIKSSNIKVMDPACGSGTMLVSAYKRFKELDSNLSHSKILEKLYGVDVSIFAAQLSEINLILQNPADLMHNCQIRMEDIFKYKENENEIDVLLGNPPFTRADRLDSEYKDFLETHLKKNDIYLNYNKKYLGLYAYFLLDSIRFLKEDGFLAFVLPLSLINSSSMKPVLNFLLKKYSFLYFIMSDVEHTFSEECSFKEILLVAKKRKSSAEDCIKFVVLKNRLSRKNINNFVRYIELIEKDYEDKSIRLRVIPQKLLYEVINTNWMIFFHDQTFFKLFSNIIRSNAVSFTNQIVKFPRYDADRGLRAGISNFFYIPNKFWRIMETNEFYTLISNEKDNRILKLPHEYLNPVLRKSSLYNKIVPEISDFIINFPKNSIENEDLMAYIDWGANKFKKSQGFETLVNRHIRKGRKIARIGIIHELSLKSGKFIAFYSPIPIVMSDNFIFIRTYNEKYDKIIAAYLNSSIFLLTYLILRREKTGSLGQIFGTDMRNFYCLNPKKLTNKDQKELADIFDNYIKESDIFEPFLNQIQAALNDNMNLKSQLDRKICEILKIENITEFQCSLYEVLHLELSKF